MGGEEQAAGKKAVRGLTGGNAYQAVYKTGSRYASSVATIYVLEQPGYDVRLGIPAGRRLGTAVRRNRVRRRIREAFARIRPTMARGAHIVVVPRSRAMVAPFASLVDALETAVSQAGLVRSFGR